MEGLIKILQEDANDKLLRSMVEYLGILLPKDNMLYLDNGITHFTSDPTESYSDMVYMPQNDINPLIYKEKLRESLVRIFGEENVSSVGMGVVLKKFILQRLGVHVDTEEMVGFVNHIRLRLR